MPRLFTAIDIPGETGILLENIFHRNPGGLKWTRTGQLHLTIRFIGETGDESFQMIREALREIRWKSFNIAFAGAGFFPNPKKPRIFHLMAEKEPELDKLRKNTDSMLADFDIPPEEREFIPHITLARIGQAKNNLNPVKLEKDFAPFKGMKITINEFLLYSSTLTRDGAIHKIEEKYQCAAS